VKPPIVFRRAARIEFDESANWYEQKTPGLGPRFTAAVGDVLNRISTQPHFYARVEKEVREALVADFPYCVYYQPEPDRIQVIAVFHASRDPNIWKARV
jgi:plasmid stabilization system protein ParE